MVILNPFEPWPVEMSLDAAAEAGVRVITRVVDYGGIFWDDVTPETELPRGDHRAFRPQGWIEEGRAKLERIRPIGERAGLTPIQLACQWNLAHEAVECVVPTLIQELGPGARPIEDKRAELEALPAEQRLSAEDVAEIRAIGDNAELHGAQGRQPRARGAGPARPLGAGRRAGRGGAPLGDRPRARPAPGRGEPVTGVLHAIRRALVGTGSTALTLVGACLIGFGVPLFWIWIASSLYGKPGAVNGPVALFIATGIVVSYYGLLLIASWVRARMIAREAGRPQRASWNRSMRDSAWQPGSQRSDPVERLFVVTAIVSLIGFAVWFAFFAGSPFPTNA